MLDLADQDVQVTVAVKVAEAQVTPGAKGFGLDPLPNDGRGVGGLQLPLDAFPISNECRRARGLLGGVVTRT
jgi:hypothetical protein